ncbi:MAG: futalosine hydrolase [Saprospiraceae bacterium]|nr:futalosine hydrolase [Saprospiraceae bacterium]
MKILFTAATTFEIAPLFEELNKKVSLTNENQLITFQSKYISISILITGVGITATTYALTKCLQKNKFDIVINAGICGAYHNQLVIGDVISIISEEFGDFGVTDAQGNFLDAFDSHFYSNNTFPFCNGKLINEVGESGTYFKKAKGVTVNQSSGAVMAIEKLHNKFNADVETMEGAAFFYVCLHEKVNFLSIRAVSNYVTERNKEAWNIPLAVENLNKALIQVTDFYQF